MRFDYIDNLVRHTINLMIFLVNFEQLLFVITSSFVLVACNFNTKTSSWWKKNSTTSKGTEIEVLTCSYGLN